MSSDNDFLIIPKPAIEISINRTLFIRRLSYYQAVPQQTDSSPEQSACGPTLNNQIAVTQDLLKKYNLCGKVVKIINLSTQRTEYYVVNDVLNSRYITNNDGTVVDILTKDSVLGLHKGILVF